MFSVELNISYLTQNKLSFKDKTIFAGPENWLFSAVFDSTSHVCADKDLSEKWTLLKKMDLIKNVGLLFCCLKFSDELFSLPVHFIKTDKY